MLNNALITGGSGMVGSNINFGIKPTSTDMDITSRKSIDNYVNNLDKISCIIHLAAINLRESEENSINAINCNINGTIKMLHIAKTRNVPFIYLSTGAVFSSNNSNDTFNETNITNPNCIYGHTKRSAEEIALTYDKTIIVRTGWLFGGNQKLHYKFVEHFINNILTNNEVKASNNFYGSPTYVLDLIDKIKELIIHNKYGIQHIVNSETASGYDVAIEICNILNKNNKLIIPTLSNLVPNPGPKNRSNTEILETIHECNKLRNWKDALKYYINNTNNIKKIWENRAFCRLCNSSDLYTFYNMERTALANSFVKEPCVQLTIPLDVCICHMCNHVQLLQIVEPSYQYNNYFYVSSTSFIMINHLKNNVDEFITYLNIKKDYNILEIGANDGVCIKHLLDNGYNNIIGIDPAKNIHNRHNLPIICDFFGSNIIPYFKQKLISFKLIYGFHCCAHIENIQDVFYTIYELLDNDGVFIMEVGYFYEVYKNLLFDTIYHEHIDYHTCTAIQKFGEKYKLLLFNVKTNDIQGGSIQFYFSKNVRSIEQSVNEYIQKERDINLFDIPLLDKWKYKIITNGRDIKFFLRSVIDNGKRVAGYGASAKSTTLLYQYKLSNNIIECIIDDSVFKQNYLSPGLHIPIKPISFLDNEKIDYIIILSWNFTDEILKKLACYREQGMRIIIPFPDFRIL
jgi:dTDP-4-dehydrorhamnose reductase